MSVCVNVRMSKFMHSPIKLGISMYATYNNCRTLHQPKACSRNLWAESHFNVQWKKHPRSSPWTFIAYPLNSNYEKSAKCNPSFLWDKFFSILPKYWQVSNYTAMLSKFSFPKMGKILSLSFRWKIYVMVEPRILWSYQKLEVLQSNLLKQPPL